MLTPSVCLILHELPSAPYAPLHRRLCARSSPQHGHRQSLSQPLCLLTLLTVVTSASVCWSLPTPPCSADFGSLCSTRSSSHRHSCSRSTPHSALDLRSPRSTLRCTFCLNTYPPATPYLVSAAYLAALTTPPTLSPLPYSPFPLRAGTLHQLPTQVSTLTKLCCTLLASSLALTVLTQLAPNALLCSALGSALLPPPTLAPACSATRPTAQLSSNRLLTPCLPETPRLSSACCLCLHRIPSGPLRSLPTAL